MPDLLLTVECFILTTQVIIHTDDSNLYFMGIYSRLILNYECLFPSLFLLSCVVAWCYAGKLDFVGFREWLS